MRLHTSIPNLLLVRGALFDTVETLGQLHFLNSKPSEGDFIPKSVPQMRKYIASVGYGSYAGSEDLRVMQADHLVANCLAEVQRLLCINYLQNYPTGKDLDTVARRTMICKRDSWGLTAASTEYALLHQAFKYTINEELNALPVPKSRYDEIVHRASMFYQCVNHFCSSRRRCLTSCGYICQVPLVIQFGDAMFIPCGSAIPFIIRQRRGPLNRYELIGECYIHGIMNGEAFEMKD